MRARQDQQLEPQPHRRDELHGVEAHLEEHQLADEDEHHHGHQHRERQHVARKAAQQELGAETGLLTTRKMVRRSISGSAARSTRRW